MMKAPASDDLLGSAEGEGGDGYDAGDLDDASLALELGVQVKAQPVQQVSDSQCPPDSFSETWTKPGRIPGRMPASPVKQ